MASARFWWPRVRVQLSTTLRMSFPLMVGQLGLMAMILIDMFMVGKLGPQAIGGTGLGSAIFYVFTLFGAGTLYGLDYLVSHAFGRRSLGECHYWLVQSVYLSICLTLPLVVVLRALTVHLDIFGFDEELLRPAAAFLNTLVFSLPPFLIFIAFRQYLQATGSVRAGTVVTLLAILWNIALNVVLIFGVRGTLITVPAMGVAGAGLATTVTRTLMALCLIVYTVHRDWRRGWGLESTSRRVHLPGLWRLFAMGAPAGLQMALEAGVFSMAASLISRLGVVAAASHTIAINISAFTYMVPLGVSGATAVLVGQKMGRQEPQEAGLVGWTSLGLSVIIMSVSGLCLVAGSVPMSALFTQNADVIELSRRLLLLVAIYQVADGLQVVGAGALRGLGDTQSAMVAYLVGYWAIGLPIGSWMCFSLDMGAVGMWLGLTLGLFAVAAFVLWRWARALRAGLQER